MNFNIIFDAGVVSSLIDLACSRVTDDVWMDVPPYIVTSIKKKKKGFIEINEQEGTLK